MTRSSHARRVAAHRRTPDRGREAGLSEPSSTRLLADLLGEATVGRSAVDAEVEVVELRPLAHAITDALLTGFPTGDLAAARSRRSPRPTPSSR